MFDLGGVSLMFQVPVPLFKEKIVGTIGVPFTVIFFSVLHSNEIVLTSFFVQVLHYSNFSHIGYMLILFFSQGENKGPPFSGLVGRWICTRPSLYGFVVLFSNIGNLSIFKNMMMRRSFERNFVPDFGGGGGLVISLS
ncbi:hypothetical protein MKW98_019110 [Papaver atlanticum]|uniref:Uncharacterized protein n=1 Tax=Papaver atlanticum TaxID=357466 RepID=A0AAD4XY75_9MAGN|nr:hypothetical protein MKW98_019110 [Papaver atlanticum]